MRRIWIPMISILVLAAGVMYFVSLPDPRWTTESPEALAEFENCLESHMRFYYREAEEHCRQAVELDPTFAIARLGTLNYVRGEERDRLVDELRQEDLSRLTPTERFQIRYRLARVDRKVDEAAAILATRLEEDPYDVFAVNIECGQAWGEQDWDRAESCYLRLLEIDPNWALAQNHLGYIAMARGDFAGAEEQFESYRFIAPDQANPHDSMGELLTLVGRYDEAVLEFEAALELRPDFCSSYRHLGIAHLMAGEYDQARATVAALRAQPDCYKRETDRLGCSVDAFAYLEVHDWEGILEVAGRESCAGITGDVQILAHEGLARLGRTEEALAIEERFRELLEQGKVYGRERDTIEALSYHMWGVRLAAEGDFDGAASRLRQADQTLVYWNDSGLGIFKLFNQVALAQALTAAGRSAEAAELSGRIREVNPRLADQWLNRDR